MENLDFLHPAIKNECLDLYKIQDYRACVLKAFSIVRGVYKEKFDSEEEIPEDFSEYYYVSSVFSKRGSREDKNFQKGCEHILRSINKLRNEIEHSKDKTSKISEDNTMHYLYLCSFVMSFLDRLEKYTNNTHPFNRDDYKNEKMKGTIKFDYSNNNGQYDIGKGVSTFTIKVSSCGENSLHIYSDPGSIKGVGLIDDISTSLSDLQKGDLQSVDMSSRTRVIATNNTGVLLNTNNRYALLRLKNATRGNTHDAEIEYCIVTKK